HGGLPGNRLAHGDRRCGVADLPSPPQGAQGAPPGGPLAEDLPLADPAREEEESRRPPPPRGEGGDGRRAGAPHRSALPVDGAEASPSVTGRHRGGEPAAGPGDRRWPLVPPRSDGGRAVREV